MLKVITEYRCNICNKQYSGYQSLWIHNKKFHISNNSISQPNNSMSQPNNSISQPNNSISQPNINYSCKFCFKIYKHQQSKSRHEKICKNNNILVDENNLLKNKLSKMEDQMKDILNKYAKIHPKTLQKINNNLINNSNNNTNNNNTINNTFIKFGNEKLANLLTQKDMLNIINKVCLCIEESIKTVHFNKELPEYSNIFITNMRDTNAYIFDGNKFILTSKDEVINELFSNHLENIEGFLEDAKIPENKYTKISKFLDALNDDDSVFIDECNNNRKYNNYKAYKLSAITKLLYNESDGKILKKLNTIDLEEKIIEDIKIEI